MNSVKRIGLGIVRNPGKSITMLLIVFVLGCVVSGALLASFALNSTAITVVETMPAMVTIEPDLEAFDNYWLEDGAESISAIPEPDLLELIGALPQVSRYDYSVMSTLIGSAKKFQRYSPDGLPDGISGLGYIALELKGTQNTVPIDLSDGVIEMVKGRTFTEGELEGPSNVAMISENFASINELGIGSIMELEKLAWTTPDVVSTKFFPYSRDAVEDDIVDRKNYVLEVVGIYSPVVRFNTGSESLDIMLSSDAENFIYVPNALALGIEDWFRSRMSKLHPHDPSFSFSVDEASSWMQNIFILHNAEEIPAFREEVAAITPPFLRVIDPVGNAANVHSAMGFLAELSQRVLIFGTGASFIVLSLVTTFFVRDREREIAIIASLGETRLKMFTLMISELTAIALLGITLSLGAGFLIASQVSRTTLTEKLTTFEYGGYGGRAHIEESLGMMGLSPGSVAAETLNAFNVPFDAISIVTIYFAAIAVVLLSTIIPLFYILKMCPRKLLMQRDGT
ncbi:MAG: FtsX-like permease family protein [Coriobacteriia bacterium]|nr:FtsX-like permease family protein [Coriobacteriia bacterium]